MVDARITELQLDPEHYDSVPVYDLLESAAHGYIGLDQRFLRAILDHREKAIPDLLRYASEDHSGDPINLEEDLISIFRYFSAKEALPFFIDLVRREPDQVSDELVDALVHVGEPALEPLLSLYEELGEENAGDIAFLLAALHVKDPRILKVLTDRLDYDLSDAALCLDVYGDPAAIPALEKMLAQIPEDDGHLRAEVAEAMETLHQPKQSDIEPPGKSDIWDLYPEEAPPAFDVLSEDDLLQMIESPSPKRRAEVAEAFLNADLSDKAAAKLIDLAKNDPDPSVRGRSWEALGDSSNEPEIRRAMLAVIEDGKRPVEERAGAVVGLAQQSDNAKVHSAIETLYDEPGGRAKALEAMWRSFDRSFAEYPPKHLKDSDVAVRRQAIWGIGQLGLTREAPALREFFEDHDFRPDALFNYALAVPSEVTRARVRSLLEKIDDAAGGLTPGETELVQMALDQRLALKGLKPVFAEAEDDHEDAPEAVQAVSDKPGRNDPCPCGSGKKYKKCHGS